ncbi:hypothetical protein M9H77_09676 [Catharanthus roseus]|uniref:Uncharacterized protein n=1 Tax=Catharanthus roseus TaxID=4058 RepID=A0ACC0C1F6_CATRO|nr:hypothetical protein M9H77_09676 [Catharanthus roseus]
MDILPINNVLNDLHLQLEIYGGSVSFEIRSILLKASLVRTILVFFDFRMGHVVGEEYGHLEILLLRIRMRIGDAIRYLSHIPWSRRNIETSSPNHYFRKGTPSISYEDLGQRLSLANKTLDHIKIEVRKIYSLIAHTNWIWTEKGEYIISDCYVTNLLGALFKDSNDLLNSSHSRSTLQDVYKSLVFLQSFLVFIKGGGVKLDKHMDLLIHTKCVGVNMACLHFLCSLEDRMDGDKALDIKFQLKALQHKINPVQPQVREIYIKVLKELSVDHFVRNHDFAVNLLDSLVVITKELSEIKQDFITSFRDEMVALYQFLDYYCYEDAQKIYDLSRHMKSLVIETARVMFSNFNANDNQEWKSSISHLLIKFENVKANARKVYDEFGSKVPCAKFPKTNFQGFLHSLLQKLEDLMNSGVLVSLKYDTEIVRNELVCLRDDFSKIPEMIPNDQWSRFIDLSYQIDYIVHWYLIKHYKQPPLMNFKFQFYYVIEEIMMIREELKTVPSRKTTDHDEPLTNFPTTVLPKLDFPSNDELLESPSYYTADGTDGMMNSTPVLVTSDEATKRILDQLTSEEKQLQIVSIVGMGGIGKTTLADSLYDHPLVRSSFNIRTRICVSKVYEKKKLFLDVLQGVIGDGTKKFVEKCDEDLEETLYENLKRQRYLIFMDDLWDIKPWLDLRASIPDDRNGSRILFTSRSHSIALETKRKSSSYQLDLLSNEKSWEMLRSKLFQEQESCSDDDELVNLGKEIAKSCKGLPLTIDLIAGVLRTKGRNKYCWQEVVENMRKEISDDPQQRCQKILDKSFSDLPDHLKSCFLYFSAFPEGSEITSKRLIWLWAAEGFIQQRKVDENLESTAEAYLNDLIARSLVIVSRRNSSGGVKVSRIHDLLHDFACRKAHEDYFLLQMKMKGKDISSSSSSYDNTNEGYRMFFNSNNWAELDFTSLGSWVSSIHMNLSYTLKSVPRPSISFGSFQFKHLRILHLQGSTNLDIHSSITNLVYLKFLAVPKMYKGFNTTIPKLHNLETVLVMGRSSSILSMDTIWNLLRLRHFHVGHCELKLRKQKDLMKSFQFANLLTLSTVCLRCNEETETIMRKLTNLQRLSCTVFDSWDYKKKCNLFPKLDFLEKLDSLKMVYVGKVLHPVGEFSFPPYLKRLTLSEFCLPWSEMSIIAELEHLEVLKLRTRAFEGDIWHMKDGDFPKLRVLSLCKLDIEEWNADEMEDELPPLEHLEVFNCRNLVELPFFLANIPTLKLIWLSQCNSSLEISADKILGEQKANENEEMEIRRDGPIKTGWTDRMEFLSICG